MTEMDMKQKNLEFSLTTNHMKAMFICQFDLVNVIRMTSNFTSRIYGKSSSHPYSLISKETKSISLQNKNLQH